MFFPVTEDMLILIDFIIYYITRIGLIDINKEGVHWKFVILTASVPKTLIFN